MTSAIRSRPCRSPTASSPNGIKFVDGHACSGSSIPASAVYAEAGVLMMSPASSNPLLTDDAAKSGWPTIMRLYTRDDAQGAFIGPWIAEKYKGKNVAVLHDKSAYGQGVADAVKATMNAGGLTEVTVRRHQCRRQGLFGAGHQAEGSQGRRRSISAATIRRPA